MELTIDAALQKAIEAHKAYQIEDADRLYTAILKASLNTLMLITTWGLLAVGVGKVDAALPFFKTALEANPNIAQFWLSYIDALIKLDRIEDAQAVFDQAKSKGVKGDAFDQLRKTLAKLEKATEIKAASRMQEEPSQKQVQPDRPICEVSTGSPWMKLPYY